MSLNVIVWVASGLLAAVFLVVGSTKLIKSKEEFVSGQPSMESFPPGLIKLIGAAEVAGAAGLILPGVLGIATWLVPAAAIGLAAVMVGAVAAHLPRREYSSVAVNTVLLALAVFVAVSRIGPERL